MTISPTQRRNLALIVLLALGLSLSAVQPLVALPVTPGALSTQPRSEGAAAPSATATTTTLTASPNPSTDGQPVVFTATVTSSLPNPTGVVTLKEGATVLGTATLVGGVATFSTLTPDIGSHVISAIYGGDGSHDSSSAPPFIAVVNYRPSVVTGAGYFCTVRGDGVTDCRGYNEQGQTNVPPTTVHFAQISAGYRHTCAVKEDGDLKCWGLNDSEQTNVPTTTVPFVQVSVGQFHTCALKVDGTLKCWGLNEQGQTAAPTATLPFVQVSAGYNHSCALETDGTLICWGANDAGQRNVPPGTFKQVSAGGSHTCALKTDGTLACWGLNDEGQTTVPPGTFVRLSAGFNHACATKADGTLACWGGNFYGQTTVPLTYSPFVEVSAGWNSTCATKIDMTLACWGANAPIIVIQPDELHRATIGAPYLQTLTAIGFYGTDVPYSFRTVSGTLPPGITLYPTGTLSGVPIAENSYEFVAQAIDVNGIADTHYYSVTVGHRGDTTTEISATPDPVVYGQNVSLAALVHTPIDVATGVVTFTEGSTVLVTGTLDETGGAVVNITSLLTGSHVISATYSGDLYFLGSVSPVMVVNVNNRPSVDVGYHHACAVKTDGTLGCWGANSLGQSTPPTATLPFAQISAGNFFNCALTETGATVCWGDNSEGQTTVPTTTVPFVQIGAGETHACAVRVDGEIVCWGNNDLGQRNVITSTLPYVQVSAGKYHTCGLVADGTINCWGRPDEGQTIVPTSTSPFLQVSAGGSHSCGVKEDHTLACWGWNIYQQASVPAPNSGWAQVSAGGNNTCAVKVGGTLICWGENTAGQPVVISSTIPFAQVGTGSTSSCGVKVDGTIACWGTNNYGQAPVVSLTPTTLPDAPAGLPYAQTIVVEPSVGLQLPYTFEVVSGSLPDGLGLDRDTGELGGIPTSIGVFTFMVRAHDVNLLGGTRVYSLRVWTSNKIETTTTINPSANPSPLGNVITFTVMVTSAIGTPTGMVTLTLVPATVLGVSPLVNGVATFTNSSLNLGVRGLSARYSGDDNYNPSVGYLNQEIGQAATEITLASSPNPSIYGRPVNFTATVTSNYGVPTGVVSFVEGANIVLGTAPVANGVATYANSALSVNPHNIRARYGGDSTFAASDSTLITQRVNDEPITGLSAANSSPIASGLTAVFSATIGNGTNVGYQWNFGDGKFGSKAIANHIYDQPGIYTAIVTATNTVGSLSATTTVTITPGSSIYIPLLIKK